MRVNMLGNYKLSGTIHLSLGSRDGAEVRALASHQCGPGSIPARYHIVD